MRKRMLRAWRTAGAVFAAYRFFIKFRHKYYKQILTVENITPIFLPKNLIYKYLFVFLPMRYRYLGRPS